MAKKSSEKITSTSNGKCNPILIRFSSITDPPANFKKKSPNYFLIDTNSPQRHDLYIEKINSKKYKIFLPQNTDPLIVSTRNLNNFLSLFAQSQYLSPKKTIHKYLSGPKIINSYFELNARLDDLEGLVFSIGKTDFFSIYQTLQVIIHEKGDSYANNFVLKNEVLKSKKIKAIYFNSLYRLIKKSRNRIFHPSKINSEYLEVAGYFLAREITYSKFTIIIACSRGEFFPPEKKEILDFESTIDLFKRTLESHVSFGQSTRQLNLYRQVFETIPLSLIIKGENDKTLLKSNIVNSQGDQEVDSYLKNEKYQALVSKSANTSFSTTFYNKERLSLLGELLNGLRHELSNPLFGLKLSLEIFDSENLDDDTRKILSQIAFNISHCEKIIERFTTLYQKSTAEDIKVSEVVSESLLLIKSEAREIRKEIIYNPPSLQDYYLNTDRVLLTQVVFNVLLNAIEALNQKGGKKILNINCSQTDDKISIAISDNGVGISNKLREKIFTPYFSTKSSGSGLGLSICKELLNSIGANITLNSKSSEYTTFVIDIPIS